MDKKKSLIILLIVILYTLTACSRISIQSDAKETQYNQAVDEIKNKHYPQAIGILSDLGDYKDSQNLIDQLRYIIGGSYIGNGIWAVAAITEDQKVKVAYNGENKDSYSSAALWENIISISFRGGDSIEGLTKEGTIITTDKITKEELANSKSAPTGAMANVVESVSLWRNIKCFTTLYPQTAVAVTNDGFVYAAYPAESDGKEKLEGWNDIVSVGDGRSYVVGLKNDGSVINKSFGFIGSIDTYDWDNIVSLSAGSAILGLKEDGRVVATGLNGHGEGNVSEWTDIIAISAADNYSLGLKSSGTVVAAGDNAFGRMDGITEWSDIIAIAAGSYFSIGLKSDGTMVLAGDCGYSGVETPDISLMKGLYVPQISLKK